MKKLIYLLSIMILGVSCESNYLEFSAESSVYFKEKFDSTRVSFTYFDNTTTDFDVRFNTDIIGKIVDYDREVNIDVRLTNCVEGIDFLQIPRTYTIEAGKLSCPIVVTLLRTEGLKLGEKVISIEIVESKDFLTLHKTENNKLTNLKTINKLRQTITYSELMTEKPKTWNDYYLGTFSYKKFTTICDVMGIPRAKFIEYSYMSTSRLKYVANTMKQYFINEKAAGRTIYEEDGVTEMRMGDKI